MSEIDTIREVEGAHKFLSTSNSRGGFNVHRAGCTCDPTLEFDWYRRGAEYQEHLYAAIFKAGRESQA